MSDDDDRGDTLDNRRIPTPEDFAPFAQELESESDRGMALSGTSYLDDRLGKLIETFVSVRANADRLIWEGNAPLSTFSSRIIMAHALGLIDEKERAELNMLRKVRNLFAHNFKQKMDDPVVVGTMGNFRELTDIIWSGPETVPDVIFAETPRARFFHAVLRLAHRLDVRKWVIDDENMRLREVDWQEHYL